MNADTRHILIVDDDQAITMVLAESLLQLGGGYTVDVAANAYEALHKMGQRELDLIVTDLRMPGMDGLRFMKKVREHYPHTRLILMTGYGNAEIAAAAYDLGACRYIEKPFKTEELLAHVRTALAEPEMSGSDILVLSDEQSDAIAQCLADLRFELGVECILLADVAGQMLANVGEVKGVDLAALVSLVGGSFATAFEMARYLGEGQARTLNYHEGQAYDIYSANVDEDLFIVLLFEKPSQNSRIGMVWLYIRRTLQTLQALVSGAERMSASQVLDDDFGALLNTSLDQLYADPGAPEGEGGCGEVESQPGDREPTLEEATRDLDNLAIGSQDPAPPETASTAPTETFDLEQALRMGLLDPSWTEGEERRE